MQKPYHLLDEPWIPVALASGQRAFVRLCDISQDFEGQPIVRIDTGRPDCDISLTEFLIGLLTVSMGPKDDRDWLRRYRNPPAPEELAAALKPFETALVLDGAGPGFFQDWEPFESETDSKKLKRIEQLFFDVPGEKTLEGNTDHVPSAVVKASRHRSMTVPMASVLQLLSRTLTRTLKFQTCSAEANASSRLGSAT